jgi:hypothetical protein
MRICLMYNNCNINIKFWSRSDYPSIAIRIAAVSVSLLVTVPYFYNYGLNRQLPTTAARVRSQIRSCEICGGQSGSGTCFLRVFRFPLPIFIPPTFQYSLIILSSTLYSPDTDSVVKQLT